MAKLTAGIRTTPSGRIGQQVGVESQSRKSVQSKTQPSVFKEITPEEKAEQINKFYSKRATDQLKNLEADKVRAQKNIDKYKAKANKTQRDSDYDKLERAEEFRDALNDITSKAASGKYNYGDLLSYSNSFADYRVGNAQSYRKLKESEKAKEESGYGAPTTIEQYDALAPDSEFMDSVKVGKSTYHAPTGMYYTRDSKGGTSATRGKENAEIQLAGMEKQRIEELKKVNISEPNYFKDTSKEIYSADIGYGTQSFSPEAYNKEIERIQRDSPRTSILDTTTGDLTSGIISPIKLSGTDFYSRTKVQVYTDPKTGEVIEDIGIYLKEKNIPYSTNKKKVDLFKPSGQLTYDTEGLKSKAYKGGFGSIGANIGKEWLPTSEAYGTVMPITPLDITLAATADKTVPFLLSKVWASPTIGSLEVADTIGYFTGANVKITSGLRNIGTAMKTTAMSSDSIFKYPLYGAGVAVGTLSYLPAESKTELAFDLAIGAGFASSSKLIKYPVKTGVAGYSGYQIATGSTAEQKALGLLGVFAVSPEIVKASRATAFRHSPDYVKTKTDVTGISYTDIDLGKIDFNADTGVLSGTRDPLRVEFIPSQSEVFTAKIDPLKTLSGDINLKETPSFPKVTDLQQELLDVVKTEGGVVSGSFAQETLVKGSRPFQDLDILVKDVGSFEKALVGKMGDKINWETKTITDSPLGKFNILKVYEKSTRKHIADIDPIKFSEEGFGRMFEPVDVMGLKLLPPEVRLTSKVLQLSRPLKIDKRKKVAKDIAQLFGDKGLETSPSSLRGYGLSKAEQKSLFLKGDFYSTHGGMSLLPSFGDKILLGGDKFGSPDLFFATPSKVSSNVAYVRKSRAGLDVKTNIASLRDIFSGQKITFFGKRKQAVIEIGKLGDDFIQPMKGTSEIEVARVLPKEGTELKIIKRFKTIIGDEPFEIAFAGKGDVSKIDSTNLKLDKGKVDEIGNLFKDSLRRKQPKQIVFSQPIRTSIGTTTSINSGRITRDIFRTDRIDTLIRTPTRTDRIDTLIRTPTRTDRIDTLIRTPTRTDRIDTLIRTPTRTDRRRLDVNIPIPVRPKTLPVIKNKKLFPNKIKQQGYIPQAKSQGGKWINLSKKPMSRSAALSRASRASDQTLSAQFRIKKAKGKVNGNGDNYFGSTKNKYRPYRIKKGQKIGLVNHFIEKRGSRIDTRGEKKGLKLAKYVKSQGWLSSTKKKGVKKKKSQWLI